MSTEKSSLAEPVMTASAPSIAVVSTPALRLPEGYSIQKGHLYMHGIDLAALTTYWMDRSGHDDTPLTIRYLPSVRTRLQMARELFAEASRQTGYSGEVRIAYASKANPNRSVIHSAIGSGADYECTSRVDVWIIRYAIEQGWLSPDQLIIANGFKTSDYADALIGVAADGHPGVMPVFDSPDEIDHFARSVVPLNVGLRFRVPGRMERFGMDEEELFAAAEKIAQSPGLTLTLFHAIEVYPALHNPVYMESLEKAIEVFKRLRAKYPTLRWFDIGGGLPTEPGSHDELRDWMASVQQLLMAHCGPKQAPGLLIEAGRYITGSHELIAFRVVKQKLINDIRYYILGGGIMSNLPDAWALGVEFPVAALNHCDAPQQDVRLGGLTCDPDDIYPAKSLLSLPTETDGLLVAFLDMGAYQDLLGGEGGAKHCLLSEGATVLIGDDFDHPTRITYRPPQPTEAVLKHLGYGLEHYSAF